MNFSCSLYSLTISVQDGNVTVHQNRFTIVQTEMSLQNNSYKFTRSLSYTRHPDIRNRLYMTVTFSDIQTFVIVCTLQ